ncbi:Maf family protein [Sphingomonas piscis]|nr:Maf family protein [Sphingomonas piscis]
MLEAAGVPFSVQPSSVDETQMKLRLDPTEIALELAKAKALNVSGSHAGDWVIGSDSVVSVEGRVFDKPRSLDEAAEHLRLFSGKTMRLTSAVALARGGQIDWVHEETADLHVRPLSNAFIADYLSEEWPAVSFCVGVFRIEGRGVQLFNRVEGSHFTILGMPLLPLLSALRQRDQLSE